MKKIISIALVVLMMFAICVPAFAADKVISNTAPDPQTAIVKTTTDPSDSSYSVTIPAETLIDWGTPSTDLTYTVSTQFETGKRLEVTVAGSGTMTDANGETLAYTLEGTTYTTDTEVVKNASQTLKVNVAADAWANAIISQYQDTLTFTATVK